MKNELLRWILVVGARPNFMKIAPIIRAIKKHNGEHRTLNIEPILVHTGQHYDYEMSQVFFQDLELPRPDIYLGVGSGTHAEQTGRVMIEFEKVLLREKPDLVVVVGDVNSTLACALATSKIQYTNSINSINPTNPMNIKGSRPLIAHIEAGLRSFDRSMPEEINRLLTDAISNFLFTPSPDANDNLKREGIPEDKIFLVGDVMVDSLLFSLEKSKETNILERLGLQKEQSTDNNRLTTDYCLLTMHRPSNVDDKDAFLRIIKALTEISKHIPVIFPVHPRTRKQIETFGFQYYFVNFSPNASRLRPHTRGIYLVDPLSYLDFLNLMAHAKVVLTDSGGIQEETTVLDIPCITLRDTTERPITLTQGTNVLVGNDTQKMIDEAFKILDGRGKMGNCPTLWDGRASERIVNTLREYFKT